MKPLLIEHPPRPRGEGFSGHYPKVNGMRQLLVDPGFLDNSTCRGVDSQAQEFSRLVLAGRYRRK
jgi:hypothetical protein